MCFPRPLTPRWLLVGSLTLVGLVIYLDARWYEQRSRALTDLVSFYLRSGGSLSTHLGPGIVAAGVEQRLGLFTQLWGSPGPGEREDVLRASLIMAASEEINRQGPAGMLQLPPLTEGGVGQRRVEVVEVGVGGRPGGVWTWGGRGEETVDSHTRGYTITLALWFHICMAAQACKSTFLVWPDANRAPGASAWTRGPVLQTGSHCCAFCQVLRVNSGGWISAVLMWISLILCCVHWNSSARSKLFFRACFSQVVSFWKLWTFPLICMQTTN